MEVNTSELIEQLKKSIISKNKYAKLEILANIEEDIPYAKFENVNASEKEIALLVCSAKEIIKNLETIDGVKEYEKNLKLVDRKYLYQDKLGKEIIID